MLHHSSNLPQEGKEHSSLLRGQRKAGSLFIPLPALSRRVLSHVEPLAPVIQFNKLTLVY